MKKHHKILMLSAVVLASAQTVVNASEVNSSNKKVASYSATSRKSLPKVSVNLNTLPVKNSGQPFKDISKSIYKNYINEIYHLGITTGYTPTTYNPNGKVTRGEMAVFLYRLAGSPSYTPPFNVFNDVTQYKTQILWLSAATVTRGTGSQYNPNGNVTRGQMAAFLHRMAVVSGKASATAKYDPKFTDSKNHMFANDIGWLRTQGITTGYNSTSFKPDASITRGEMAAFLQRFYTKINKQTQSINHESLKVKNTTLYKDSSWTAKDNFVSATSKEGKSVSLNQVKVSGKVDTSKSGTYTVTYSYGGKSVDAQLNVNENIDSSFIKDIMTTDKPVNTLNAGINMGNGHDRQDLGIQLEKNSVIKIKQINPKYQGNLSLRLLTNDSYTESQATFSGDEIQVTAKDLCVPFIDTPYNQTNGEKPKVEVVIEGGKRYLPKYNSLTSLNSFSNKWNTNGGYALLQGSRFQTLFPEENKTQVLSKDLNNVIDLYDNKIIGFYNELIGLSSQAQNSINKVSSRRYFYKADKHGGGGLYYGNNWSAQSGSSADAWLSDGWGVLHETGHGYQGSFMGRGMNTGEVWNNIYGVIYNYKYMGKEKADSNSWLYDYGNKTRIEDYFKELINNGNMNYNNQDLRGKLLILSNIIDKSGNSGLQYFYTKYREYANQRGFDSSSYLLPDLLVQNLGYSKKYDFSAILSAWNVTVKEESKQFAKEQGYQMVSHLAQVVPDDRLQEAINKFTINDRLSSALSLVTNKELDEMGLTSNVTLQFPDKELFQGTNLQIYRDNQLYCEVPLNKESIVINNMPNGVYSLKLDSNTIGYIPYPYLFVKDNRVINISLVNYVKEATQAVLELYQENTEKIKSNIMQQDIDHAKLYVDALPESEEKSALLNRVENAFNQIQEFTFRGLSDWTFVTLDVIDGLATVKINSGQPHVYFTDQYASISVTRNGSIIYNKQFIGNKNYVSETNTIPLETGDLVSITHKEANDTRLAVNHLNLKNNSNGTYNYRVENGLLKLVN